MTRKERIYQAKLNLEHKPYKRYYYTDFDYSILSILTNSKKHSKEERTMSDCIIMVDTETSKCDKNTTYIQPYVDDRGNKRTRTKYNPVDNKVVIWTISLRYEHINIATLYGRKPSECVECIGMIVSSLRADMVVMYVHYLSYDWTFLQRFFMNEFGLPVKQLNTKSHYPISIEFENGLVLRDSLILAQRGLGKWAKDMGAEHQKAMGNWDYDKFRTQTSHISRKELMYAEYDTLCGVECLDATFTGLGCNNMTIPMTATGIPRGEVKQLAFKSHFKSVFNRIALSYELYLQANQTYHGGYVHANRHYIDYVIKEAVKCFDFASSYPYTMIAYKFPMGEFVKYEVDDYNEIINSMDKWAYMFKLVVVRPRIKDNEIVMPYLQSSKCIKLVNPYLDNGRVVYCDYAEIYYTEYDLALYLSLYEQDEIYIMDCYRSYKDYLPKWFRDYVFKCFTEKTHLKNKDKVLYSIAKSKLNSLYGMCCQKPIQPLIKQNYEKGTYYTDTQYDPIGEYEKYLNRKSSVLPYQWGVWVTAIATYNLYQLGACGGVWIYSDTDSVYGLDWDMDKVKAYNQSCIDKIQKAGYGSVFYNDRDYWLGVAEHKPDEDTYSQFVVQGAKRYAGMGKEDNAIHITVAGVPKEKGAKCLNSLEEFTVGFVFEGEKTGKETHHYIPKEIYIDKDGDEVADSVDLTPCDYELSNVDIINLEDIFELESEIEIYEGDVIRG